MDYQQMRYVTTIAQCGNMTKAAEQLLVSQSTLSMSYMKLEEELGVKLFEKRGRRLVLTPEGTYFCEEAAKILQQVADLQKELQRRTQDRREKVVLCTEAMDYSNEAIKLYSVAYPNIAFQQIHARSRDVTEMLRSGQASLAISLTDISSDTIESVLLLEEPMYVMTNRSSELAGRTTLSMKQLQGLPLITQPSGYGISSLVDHFYQAVGVAPGTKREVADQESIGIQVINDYGIGFLPECVAHSEIPQTMFRAVGVTPIPLSDAHCRRKVYLSRRREKSSSQVLCGFSEFLIEFGQFAAQNSRYPTADEFSVKGNYRLNIRK